MLAPRKKLWSTPSEVIKKALEMLSIQPGDVLLDIGCGDGRVMIEAASSSSAVTCIGIEIDEARAQEARDNISEAGVSERCTVICGNALEQDFSAATKVFLYLIPRGLRIILPILEALDRENLDVVTYMSPFPAPQLAIETYNVETAGHKDAKWPLFLYRLNDPAAAAAADAAAATAAAVPKDDDEAAADESYCAGLGLPSVCVLH